MLARRLRIQGKVQGVYYRESMRQEAMRLGVCGWVRNRLDGSVEALIQGDARALDQLEEWSRRGPSRAQVTSVIPEVAEPESGLFQFERRDTA